MLHWGRSTTIVGLCAVLVACGGGGGGGGKKSDPRAPEVPAYTFLELQSTYDGYRRQRYQGEISGATLDAGNTGQFGSLVASATANEDALPRIQAAKALAAASHTSARLIQAASVNTGGQSTSGSAVKISPVIVNESESCDVSGTVALSGQLADDGTGGLDVVFRNCNDDGQTTLNGNGAIYFFDPDGLRYVTFYNGVTFQTATSSHMLTGSLEHVESEYDGILGMPISREAHSLLVQSGARSYMSENLVISRGLFSDALVLRGQLYLPAYGYVHVDTLETCYGNGGSYLPQYGKLSIRGFSGNAQIQYTDTYSRIYLDLNDDDTFDLATNLTADLSTGMVEAGTFVALDDLNTPPIISTIYFLNGPVNTTNSISVSVPYTSDYDGDPVGISYEWRLNGQAPLANTTDTLAPGIAQKGDTVTVVAIADDGRDQARSSSISLVVEDAPGSLEWQSLEDSITPGETASFSVRYQDPDAADFVNARQPFKLNYGPSGMRIETDGTLRWTAGELMFGVAQTYTFNVSIEGNNTPSLTGSIRVEDPSAVLPLARSGIQSPASGRAILVGSYDNEPGNEVLLTDGLARVMLLHEDAGAFKQKWLYPFTLGDAFSILSVIAVDQDNNGNDKPLVVADRGMYLISDLNRPAKEIYRTQEREYIVAADKANLDSDPGIEVVILVSNDNYFSSGNVSLRVIDLDTGTVQWSKQVVNANRGLVIGNVDSDANREIILGNGLVYDGMTQANEWYYGLGFGDSVTVADVDGNGIQEIVGARSWSGVSLFNAVQKKVEWTQSYYNPCTISGGNVDNDPQDEVMVGDCQWGGVFVLEASSGAPVQQWATTAMNYSVVSLASGDVDDDGDIEVVWGLGSVPDGEHVFAVADVASGTSETWYGGDPARLDYFIAAGWGSISPERQGAAFVSPSTNGGYDGQRIVTMDPEGNLDISEEISSNFDRAQFAYLNDYDQDGFSELFMGSAAYYDGYFQVRQLLDGDVEWSSSPNDSSTIGVVTSARLNDDIYEDALYVDAGRVIATDVVNQVLLWTSPDFGYVTDLAAANLGGPSNDIIIASSRELSVWRKSGEDYIKLQAAARDCSRILAINVNEDSQLEIVCIYSTSYNWDGDTSEVVIYDASLQQLAMFQLPGTIIDAAPAVGASPGHVFVASTLDVFDWGSQVDSTTFSLVSLPHQSIVWTSPAFPGDMQPHSLHPFFDSEGKQRLTFATRFAMYITR